jgi:hypothetical protein
MPHDTAISPEEQRQVLEETWGPDPFKPSPAAKKNKGVRWTAERRREQELILQETGRVKPVVIVNFNPFPLRVNGGMLFKDSVPSCPIGEAFVARVLREPRWMTVDKGVGMDNIEQFDPIPYLPAQLATEYIREYVSERQTGGVLIFMGSGVPKDLNVEVQVPVQQPGGEGTHYIAYYKRNLKEMWDQAIQQQNLQILKSIELANNHYEVPETRNYLTDEHRLYARLGEARGLIKKEDMPRWVISRTVLTEDKPEPCPACGAVPLKGAAVCVNCGDYVFDRLKAFRAGVIDIEHRSMADATDAEWKEIQNIQKRRDRVKAQREGAKA